jgi:hypothetical protein
MNLWKPLAISSTALLTLVVGYQAAFANSGSSDTSAPAMGVCHDQANMAAALGSLRAARASLDHAEHDKGGWRGAAIGATNNAIAETERGCAFAR